MLTNVAEKVTICWPIFQIWYKNVSAISDYFHSVQNLSETSEIDCIKITTSFREFPSPKKKSLHVHHNIEIDYWTL